MYTCRKCGKQFEVQQRYALHLATHALIEKYKGKEKVKRIETSKICIVCGTLFVLQGTPSEIKHSRTTCSKRCSNKLSTKNTKGRKKKQKCYYCNTIVEVSFNIGEKDILCEKCKAIKKPSTVTNPEYFRYECKKCHKKLKYAPKTGFCRCCMIEYQKTDEYKKILSKNVSKGIRKAVREGRHVGWKTRKIISYPEQFFQVVLNNNNLDGKYEINKPFSKKSLGFNSNGSYFLDFFFKDKNLDLEIDGSQHDYPDRKESDLQRDELLTKNGIRVYRIKWRDIRSLEGKEYIRKEIDKFLLYYRELGEWFKPVVC